MKSFKNIVLLIVLGFVVTLVRDLRTTMPTSPGFGNVAYGSNVNVVQRTVFGTAMSMSTWDVEDYYVFKLARMRNSPDVPMLITTIFSEGKWHR